MIDLQERLLQSVDTHSITGCSGCRMFTGCEGDGSFAPRCESVNSGVDGFCTAACEDNFGRIRVETSGDALATVFENRSGVSAETVLASGIGEGRHPGGCHRFGDFRKYAGGRVVVKIDS